MLCYNTCYIDIESETYGQPVGFPRASCFESIGSHPLNVRQKGSERCLLPAVGCLHEIGTYFKNE